MKQVHYKQMKFRFSSKGFSMIELLVSLGIISIVFLGLSRLLTKTQKGEKSLDSRYQIAQLQQLVRAKISCSSTLGVGPGTMLPLSCANFAQVKLRDHQGREIFASGQFSSWTVSASCANSKIVVSALKSGVDPLTQQPWAASPYAQDLFNGTSDFCYKFFVGQCGNAYPIQVGWSNGDPSCCREESITANSSPPFIAEASCASHEYLKAGGGICWWGQLGWVPPPGVSIPVSNFGPVPKNGPDITGNKWVFDCHTVNNSVDQYARSSALCCPKNQ